MLTRPKVTSLALPLQTMVSAEGSTYRWSLARAAQIEKIMWHCTMGPICNFIYQRSQELTTLLSGRGPPTKTTCRFPFQRGCVPLATFVDGFEFVGKRKCGAPGGEERM